MKPLFLFIIAIVLLIGCATENKMTTNEIPSPVLDSFKMYFPNIYLADWSVKNKKKSIIYVVKWELGNNKHKAKFMENGKLIERK